MKKTIALCRVSSNAQDLQSQENAISEYCKRNNIVVNEWIKEEGISGYKVAIKDRDSLNYIKELALNGELGMLLIFNSDRIIRQTEGSLYLKTLALNGVRILSVTEGELYSNAEIDELLTFIRFYQSNNEAKKISNRVRAGKKVAFANGKFQGGKVNYGYKYVDKKLQIDEKEAIIVRKLYEIYNSKGTNACLQWLENNNITKRGYTWTANSIWQLLTNSIYYGQSQSKKHSIPFDNSLAIVDRETWEYTQKLYNSRRTKGTTKHTNKSEAFLESIFYHKVGNETHKLYVDYSYSNGKKRLIYRCYTCKTNKNKPKGIKYSFSGNKYHKIIEKEIETILSKLSVEQLESEYNKARALELTSIQVELDNLTNVLQLKRKALEGANKALENIFNGTLDIDIHIVNNKIKSIQNEIIDLEGEFNSLSNKLQQKEVEQMNKNRLLNKYKDFKYLWNIANDEDKKAIAQELINRIIIEEDNIEIKLNI